MYVCMFVHANAPWRPEEGSGSPGAGVVSCEPPNVDAGNSTPDLCKSSKSS